MGSGIIYDIKKWCKNTGVDTLLILLVVIFGIGYFFRYISNKGGVGSEFMTSNAQGSGVYQQAKHSSKKNAPLSTGVIPSEPLGQNEIFASVSGISTPSQGIPTACSKPNIQNPAELLPKDSNSQWAQLNPTGKGELANINLLKAGYHIGIDTVGQSLRNANLQIRSEPPNPQTYVGPWQQSTITPDFMRPPLEIGSTTGTLQ